MIELSKAKTNKTKNKAKKTKKQMHVMINGSVLIQ